MKTKSTKWTVWMLAAAWTFAVGGVFDAWASQTVTDANGDQWEDGPGGRVMATDEGTYPPPTPKASDVRFVVKTDDPTSGNMGSIQGSNITFYIPIDRYFGDKEALLENKALPETATLTMAVWDVDEAQGEVDEVSINDVCFEGKRTFYGANQKWKANTFQIPITLLNLPSVPGETTLNKVSIDISVGDPGQWVTRVDWASLDIPAPPPVVISHGIWDSASGMTDLKNAVVTNLGLPVETFSYGLYGFNSIESGAKDLAAAISAAKTNFGVDKVTILCHSMGGIKARHYTTEIDRNAESVDRVIQIATPNGGNNLACFRGLLGPVWANTLAIVQLDPFAMAAYNSKHLLNHHVKYVVLAGDKDVWAPVESAHTMVPPHSRSPVHDDRSTHKGLVTKGRSGMVDTVIGNILRNDLLEPKHSEDAWYPYGTFNLNYVYKPDNDSLNTYSVGTGTVNLGSTSFAFPFQVSSANRGEVTVSFLADEIIEVSTIRSPSGRVYSPDDDGIQCDPFAGIMTIHIASAEAGTWTVIATRGSGGAALPYAVAVQEADSDILLGGAFATETARVGSSFVLELAPTKAGAALTGLSGSVAVILPDGTEQTVTLANAGTGRYRATFRASQAGTYLATAKMTVSGVEYASVFTCTAYDSNAKFGTLAADGPADDDGDGFYDRLSVSGTLSGVSPAASYRVFALLADQNGTNIAWAAETVTNGATAFRLDFDGVALYEHGPATKYVVSALRLSEQGDAYEAEIDARDGEVAFQGMSWAWSDFVHPLVDIPGTGTDGIIATSASKPVCKLSVGMDIAYDASVAGTYEYSLSLKTVDGILAGTAYGTLELPVVSGIATVRLPLEFDGAEIAFAGADGPYRATDMLLWNASQVLTVSGAYETQAWKASDFFDSAVDPESGVAWIYRVSGNVATVWGSKPASGNLAIPAELGGIPVTGIGDHAFSGCYRLESVEIPDVVRSIGRHAFDGCAASLFDTESVPGVRLVDGWAVDTAGSLSGTLNLAGVRGIAAYTFCDCTNLTGVTISDSVRSIGKNAFTGCTSLTAVNIHDLAAWCRIFFDNGDANPLCRNYHYTTITQGPKTRLYLNGMELTGDLVIPDGVTSLGTDLFCGCRGLTSVTIPASVTNIEDNAFWGCIGLTAVNVRDLAAWCRISFGTGAANPLSYKGYSGGPPLDEAKLYLNWTELKGDLEIPHGVTSIGKEAFSGCSGLTSVTIPESVTNIGGGAFYDCSGLTDMTIPDAVTSIGNSTFSGCTSLSRVTIPGSVTNIGNYAFYRCRGLTSVTIPESVTNIGSGAFYDCSGLTDMAIPDGVTSIGAEAFSGCTNLACVTMPDSVTDIGDHAFQSCRGLINVVIPDGVTNIGNYAFSGCGGLTNVTIPDGVILGDGAFEFCSSLTNMTLLGNVTWRRMAPHGGHDALGQPVVYTPYPPFLGCTNLSTVVLGEKMTSICGYLFEYCTGLTNLTIPCCVTNIDEYAFSGCSGLKSLIIPDSVTSIGANAFYGCSNLATLYVPESWKGTTILANAGVPEGCQIIYGEFTKTVDGIEWTCSVTNGTATVTRANPAEGDLAIPSTLGGYPVTAIGEVAFLCCGLTSVTIPANVTDIGNSAFERCTGLANVAFGSGVKNIGESAFYLCTNLAEISIPDSVTNISDGVFCACSGLKTASIGNGVTSIGVDAFYKCSGLTNVTIGTHVTNIGSRAFYGCSGLTSMAIPNSVTSIGTYAFYGCSNLATLYVPESWKGMTILANAGVPDGCQIVYYAMATASGVPYRWLQEKALAVLAANGGDYEAAAMAMAANGVNTVVECYVAGMNPQDADAVFKATISFVEDKPVVSSTPRDETSRNYTVYGKRNLTDESEDWREVADPSRPEADGYRFFRVGVSYANGKNELDSLGGVSGLVASGGTHYDGVHLSWTGPNGATQYRVYRGITANAASKSLLTTTSSTYYIDTTAAKLQKYYYYWVEPIAVVSGTTYTGTLNTSPVSGWRNKLGTPTFHFENWRPGDKSRPDIDLYIDTTVPGATRYEYISGDTSAEWSLMDAVGESSEGYDIASMTYGCCATIGWAWAHRYKLKVYVRAANDEGVGDWVKWNIADHLNESAFRNSEFYKAYPQP